MKINKIIWGFIDCIQNANKNWETIIEYNE